MIKVNDVVILADDFDETRSKGYIGKVVEIDDDGDDTNYKIRRYYPSSGKMSAKSKGVFVPSHFVVPYFAVGSIAERDDGNFVKIVNNDNPTTLIARRYYPSSGKMSAKDKGHEYSPNDLTKPVDAVPDCEDCDDSVAIDKIAAKIALPGALLSILNGD